MTISVRRASHCSISGVFASGRFAMSLQDCAARSNSRDCSTGVFSERIALHLLGWGVTVTVKNKAFVHMKAGMDTIMATYPILGVDFDNGSEFLNWGMIA